MIRTVVVGVTGRMGLSLLRVMADFPQIQLAGAVSSGHSSALGRDTGELVGAPKSGVPVTPALQPLLGGANLVIDFSTAQAAAATVAACSGAGVPLLIGTTGLPRELDAALDAAAAIIPVLVAANTSIAMTLLLKLVREAARSLGPAYDIEIVEVHHRDKVDSPSGTALALGRAAAAGRGVDADSVAITSGRTGARGEGQIGIAVVRGGDVVGEHEVLFLGRGERLSLAHIATDRTIFARGALLAGQWLVKRPAGRYAMTDIFR